MVTTISIAPSVLDLTPCGSEYLYDSTMLCSLVIGDVPVDNETSVVTLSISRISIFEDAHMSRVYVHMFIDVSMCIVNV